MPINNIDEPLAKDLAESPGHFGTALNKRMMLFRNPDGGTERPQSET
jgi:hypothetical protein